MSATATSGTHELTAAVIRTLADAPNPRLKQVMSSLVQHLHDFVRDVNLQGDEWFQAVQFLTATGQQCSDKRQEFMLLSDNLGLSMLVIALAQEQARMGREGSTPASEATVQGPYYWEGAPELPLGSDLAQGVPGEPALYSGRVTDLEGQPLAGALLDVWSGDGDGVYDMDIDGAGMRARGRIRTDAQGRYWFWSIRPTYYPIPMDGPVGNMMRALRRDPNRPGHLHMKVSASGFRELTTHIFVKGSPYLDTDPVFGVRDSLIVEFERSQAGSAPDGRAMATPYYVAHYDFRLIPQA